MKRIGLEIAALVLFACMAASCTGRNVSDDQTAASPAQTAAETGVHPIDAAFDASHPEPDGSTASMLAYADAYYSVWKAEAHRLAGELSLEAELAEWEAALAVRAEEELEAYRIDGDAPYGSLAAPAVLMMEAEAYREWVLANESAR